MEFVVKLDEKILLVKEIFSALIGEKISHIEMVKTYCSEYSEDIDDDISKWEDFPDIPIFVCFSDKQAVSVCWEGFDSLAIAQGRQLSFSPAEFILKWRVCDISEQEQTLNKVYLASNSMEWDNEEIKIWIHLLLEFDSGIVLEIANNLDENQVKIHDAMPDYETILIAS